MRSICSIPVCGRPVVGRGLCREHYYRWHRHGDPLAGRVSQGGPLRWLNEHRNYDGDDCLIWPFRRGGCGYAYIADGPATRVMCELAHGPAPSLKYESAHSCGQGHLGCVNPRHLRWATKLENEDDKLRHGTFRRGNDFPWTKLDKDTVREIRALKGMLPQTAIAAKFGVSRSNVSSIQQRKTWEWVK